MKSLLNKKPVPIEPSGVAIESSAGLDSDGCSGVAIESSAGLDSDGCSGVAIESSAGLDSDGCSELPLNLPLV